MMSKIGWMVSNGFQYNFLKKVWLETKKRLIFAVQ